MSYNVPADSGEDVTDFLRRIKELGEQRDREDAERTRKLEEEIVEGRRQREARRAERARSLSPEKQSNPGTPRSLRSPSIIPDEQMAKPSRATPSAMPKAEVNRDKLLLSSAVNPTAPTPRGTSPEREHITSSRECEQPASPKSSSKPSPSNAMPIRSGTLSWQQRPASLRGPRSRPLSTVDRNPSPLSASPVKEQEPTRANIAKELGSKEPSFFRQTADRGVGSAAYRKTQVEETDTIDHGRSATPQGRQLHGLIRAASIEPEQITASPQTSAGARPLITESPSYAPETTVTTQRPSAVENYPNPLSRSPVRSASPTKGLGGFVSSAMLRSDSVNKLHSAQPSTTGDGPIRQDSNARFRRLNRSGSKDGLPSANSMPRLGDASNLALEHRASIEDKPRPSSSYGDAHSITNKPQSSYERSQERPTTPKADRSSVISPQMSPTKRWSPTKNKSSWLESALKQPESPKTVSQPNAARMQPAWLVDLNRNKQQRMSKDISANVAAEVVTNPSIPLEPSLQNTNEDKHLLQKDSETSQQKEQPMFPKSQEDKPQIPQPRPKPARLSEGLSEVVDKVEIDQENTAPVDTRDAVKTKTKPNTPPKKDLRSSLRSTPASPTKREEEPEFKSAFGKLKRTQTQNYKAPDVLKNNIEAGKAALNITGGPQPSVRRDEFKESLLERKKTMKEKAPDPKLLHKPKLSDKAEEPIPEAFAKRRVLGRNESSGNVQSPSAENKTPQPVVESQRLSAKPSGNRLADRFNTSLANLIARGPGATPGSGNPSDQAGSMVEPTPVLRKMHSSEEPQSGVQLEHMTKARARGPRRRAPKAAVPISAGTSATSPTSNSKPALPSSSRKVSLNRPSSSDVLRGLSKPSPIPAEPLDSTRKPLIDVPHTPPKPPAISTAPVKGGGSTKRENIRVTKIEEPATTSTSPTKQRPLSVRDATALWGQQSQREVPAEVKLPIKLPSRSNDPGPAVRAVAKIQPSEKPTGKDPGSTAQRSVSSQSEATSDASKAFADFFGEVPARPKEVDFDVQSLLDAPSPGKVKTIRQEICEITGDGRKSALLSHQEHILYRDSMYLCTHVFGDQKGVRLTEVYLWIGSGVSDSVAEDVQVFAKRAAKEANGTLVTFCQGKETANFMQAIGGILITRNRKDSAVPERLMLCGRRYLGHMVFDEVAFALSSLTAAFPFALMPKPGKIYLWKGIGCHAEELGCARLIATDLGPAAEVIEVEQGKEGPDFLGLFPEPRRVPRSAEHWKRKPAYGNYKTRLFRVEQGPAQTQSLWGALTRRPSHPDASASQVRIEEVAPFAQSDLDEERIYVLDAFFEIYITSVCARLRHTGCVDRGSTLRTGVDGGHVWGAPRHEGLVPRLAMKKTGEDMYNKFGMAPGQCLAGGLSLDVECIKRIERIRRSQCDHVLSRASCHVHPTSPPLSRLPNVLPGGIGIWRSTVGEDASEKQGRTPPSAMQQYKRFSKCHTERGALLAQNPGATTISTMSNHRGDTAIPPSERSGLLGDECMHPLSLTIAPARVPRDRLRVCSEGAQLFSNHHLPNRDFSSSGLTMDTRASIDLQHPFSLTQLPKSPLADSLVPGNPVAHPSRHHQTHFEAPNKFTAKHHHQIMKNDMTPKRRKSWLPGLTKVVNDPPSPARAWIGGHQGKVSYDTSRLANACHIPELWDDSGNILVYLFSATSGKGPSFRIHSDLIASSTSLTTLARASSSTSQCVWTTPSTESDECSSRRSNETFSSQSSGNNDQPITLFLSLSLSTTRPFTELSMTDNDVETVVAIRNMFAFLVGQSLVCSEKTPTIFSTFLKVSDLLSAYDFTNIDGSTFGEIPAASFDNYVYELSLADVRGSREKTIEALILGERMRCAMLYNEAFTHSAGKYKDIQNAVVQTSAREKFDLVTGATKSRLERAALDLDTRKKNVDNRLKDFDFPSVFGGVMSSKSTDERKHINFDAWKSAFLAMRKAVLSFYKHHYGSWPPKVNKKSQLDTPGLNRLVLQSLYYDFAQLYDLWVDRSAFTTRTGAVDKMGELPSHRVLRRVFDEYDNSMPPIQPPIPYDVPILHNFGTTRSEHNTDTKKHHKARDKKLDAPEIDRLLDLSCNNDILQACARSPFVSAIRQWERKHARGCTLDGICDLRAGAWMFLYTVIQALPMLVVDAPGVCFHHGVEYFLCEPPRSGVPWVQGHSSAGRQSFYRIQEGGGIVSLPSDLVEHGVEAIYRRSHCWQVAARWNEPNSHYYLTQQPLVLQLPSFHDQKQVQEEVSPRFAERRSSGVVSSSRPASINSAASRNTHSQRSSLYQSLQEISYSPSPWPVSPAQATQRGRPRESALALGLEALPMPSGMTSDVRKYSHSAGPRSDQRRTASGVTFDDIIPGTDSRNK
ncbi:hypothetical protein FH972_025679 [Carpinus fangiana]|uniref:DUF4045 domain-containing protein n=1 Tax=Carpinus fangiana TaxID=176857 RepID=A0A5N6L1P3_9ROSI|nr:hypothetical protein FH972_025679 [Carpinus fangiana]